MKGSFLFLGTGASMGVPMVGCECSVCLSSFPKNKRLRSSGLFTIAGKNILLDAGPDIRGQMLKYPVKELHGFLVTHTHFDHIAGIDDLRVFCFGGKKLPTLLSKETFEEIKIRFHYLFEERKKGIAQLDPTLLDQDMGSSTFAGITIDHVTYKQSGMRVNGYKIGNLAYLTDIQEYDPAIIPFLQGTEILIVSALRKGFSPAHLTIEKALAFREQIGAKQTFFTHIAHELEHEKTNQELPEDVSLAYDGLEIDFYYEY